MDVAQNTPLCPDTTRSTEAYTHGSGKRAAKAPLQVLTGLRFVAASVVVANHFWPISTSPHYGPFFLRGAVTAVTFFFVLSGFILTYVYADTLDNLPILSGAKTFWHARFARIAPVYYLSLLISLPPILYAVFVSRVSTFNASVILTPLFLQAWWPNVSTSWNAPAWSLSAECFFYLIFPFLIRFIKKIPDSALLLSTYILVSVTALIVPPSMIPERFLNPSLFWMHFRAFFPLLHLPSFLFGVAVARAYSHYRKEPLKHAAALFWLAAAALPLLLGLRGILPAALSSNLTIVPLSGALIWLGSQLDGRKMLLSTPLMLLLGEASYALYILHVPLLWWWKWLMTKCALTAWQSIPSAISLFILVNMIAAITFIWFETPVRRKILGHIENRMG